MARKKINQDEEQKINQADILPQIYLNLFEANAAGNKIMDDLTLRFLMRPSVVPGAPEHMTFVREGERNVLLYIYQQIANAKT